MQLKVRGRHPGSDQGGPMDVAGTAGDAGAVAERQDRRCGRAAADLVVRGVRGRVVGSGEGGVDHLGDAAHRERVLIAGERHGEATRLGLLPDRGRQQGNQRRDPLGNTL